MIDGRRPVELIEVRALAIADRDIAQIGKRQQRFIIARKIEQAMQGNDRRCFVRGCKWHCEAIKMRMDDVKLAGASVYLREHRHVRSVGLKWMIKAQRLWSARDKARARLRVARGEERDFMPKLRERLGQGRDDTLRAAIGARGGRQIEWSYLGDTH